MRMLQGQGSLATSHAEVHRHRKRILFQAFRKMNFLTLVNELSQVVFKELEAWHQMGKIEVYKCAKLLTIKAAFRALFRLELTQDELEQVLKDLQDYMEGFFTLPVQFPGTPFTQVGY